MRAAPPAVEVSLGSGYRERTIVALLYAVAGAVLLGWGAAHRGLPVALFLPAGALTGATVGAFMLKPLRGRLRWDGAGWSLLPPAAVATPLRSLVLQIDVGGWLLLRAQGAGARAGWVGLSRKEAGSGWHALRVALYHAASIEPAGAGR